MALSQGQGAAGPMRRPLQPCCHGEAVRSFIPASRHRPCGVTRLPAVSNRRAGPHARQPHTTPRSRCQHRHHLTHCSQLQRCQSAAADVLALQVTQDEPYGSSSSSSSSSTMQAVSISSTSSTSSSTAAGSYAPVSFTRTIALPTQTSWGAAAAALSCSLEQQAPALAALPSGCLRLEAPLPLLRTTSALRWLQGQPASGTHQVYFSQRRSTAPDTPGAKAAAAAAAGWTSVAGQGAAWLWQGLGGEQLGGAAVGSCRRFLSGSSPGVKVLGGGRFNPEQPPAPEWAGFGSYCFVLPQLEVTEADQVLLLAVQVAWDSRYSDALSGSGPATAAAAIQQAQAALAGLAPPAPVAAPCPPACPAPPQHTPDHGAWQQQVGDLLGRLAPSKGLGSPAAALAQLDRGLAQQEFLAGGQQGLDDLLAALGDPSAAPASTRAGPTAANDSSSSSSAGAEQQPLTKVVLARRSAFTLPSSSQPAAAGGVGVGVGQPAGWAAPTGLLLLEALQARDPRAYQLYLSVPDGGSFLSSTPERLYARCGDALAAEAVAGTRPRGPPGDVQADFYLGLDLLQSDKDHVEFTLVRNWIQSQLSPLCGDLEVEVTKSVIKMAAVQHLYGRLAGRLAPGRGDGDLLAALHPTPAVCGRPRRAALQYLTDTEAFDRGFYSGPFGWMSGQGAEFVVAIRSALLPGPAAPLESGPQLLAFAGVGVVPGSVPQAEWEELNLKVRQFAGLLATRPALSAAPNINAAAAALLVEECCRAGVTTFCVAPGSRSSPLALAVARHPRVSLNVGIDERSLGFWALGAARAAGRPVAVVTSSGTAVANLLPAVVEASQSGVPLLLMTADRPPELRATGANQTIDQVKLFGSFVRWQSDLPPPSDTVPGRVLLTTLDTALRHATAQPPGPVHLNLQFREPLAPTPTPWDPAPFTQGLGPWLAGSSPFGGAGGVVGHPGASALTSSPLLAPLAAAAAGQAAELSRLLPLLQGASRGLLVVGELVQPEEAAAAGQLAGALGWPCVTDVLSGMRVGLQQPGQDCWPSSGSSSSSSRGGPVLVHHMDLLLLGGPGWWGALQPQVVVTLGRHLTSKRLAQFLEWSALGEGNHPPTTWVALEASPERHDPSHLVTQRLPLTPGQLLAALQASSGQESSHTHPAYSSSSSNDPAAAGGPSPCAAYASLLLALDRVASAQAAAALSSLPMMTEMAVAATLAAALPPCHALFLGNSMPIRDMDAFGGPQVVGASSPLPPPPPADAWLAPTAAAVVSSASPGGGSVEQPAAQDPLDGILLGSLPLGGLMATPQPSPSTTSLSSSSVHNLARPASHLGVPIAANRGASGIDGVLSTAAGFAAGLRRPVTLVVGDLSFLHDVNGLGLLRGGEMRPPLTVVLINNGGGGIFSFLPVAGAVEPDAFEELWGTPQAVDLEGLCRAHGIPHQKVGASGDLAPALAAAWGLNRHSVVEVTTDRAANLAHHRQVQAQVAAAVARTYQLLTAPVPAPLPPASSPATPQQHQQQQQQPAGYLGVHLAPALTIAAAQVEEYQLPLAHPVTTGDTCTTRRGWLLRVRLTDSSGRCYSGVGEAAPLPGLHSQAELAAAGPQLALLAQLIQGLPLPREVGVVLLQGSRPGVQSWLGGVMGVDPGALWPSVGLALEAALLGALAAASGCQLWQLLSGSLPPSSGAYGATTSSSSSSSSSSPSSSSSDAAVSGQVQVAGLLPGSGPVEEVVAAAQRLVAAGASCLKLKVGRRDTPAEDAAVVLALRQALGPGVQLRADANRTWDLAGAVAFGRLVAGLGVSFVEEPCGDPGDCLAFWQETGVAVGLDESLEDGTLLLPGQRAWGSQVGAATSPSSSSSSSSSPAAGTSSPPAAVWLTMSSEEEEGAARAAAVSSLLSAGGCGALVVKPSLLGSLQGVVGAATWAAAQGAQLVISSSFESGVGISVLAELAAAVDHLASTQSSSSSGSEAAGQVPVAHGLGTLSWLAGDVTQPGLTQLCAGACGGSLDLAASQQVLAAAAAAAAGAGPVAAQSMQLEQAQQEERQVPASVGQGTQGRGMIDSLAGPESSSSSSRRSSSSSTELDGSHTSSTGSHPAGGTTQQLAAVALTHCVPLVPVPQQVAVSVPLPHPSSPQLQLQVQVAGCLLAAGRPKQPAGPAAGSSPLAPALVFLHGFLGSSRDWQPLMAAAAAAGHTCLALDLPGHGATTLHTTSGSSSSSVGSNSTLSSWANGNGSNGCAPGSPRQEPGCLDPSCYSLEVAAAAVAGAAAQLLGPDQPVVLVGYSLGARAAAQLVAAQQQPGGLPLSLAGAVLLGGSPGLDSSAARAARVAADDGLAAALADMGRAEFSAWWYAAPLWESLRQHPAGQRLIAARSSGSSRLDSSSSSSSSMQQAPPGTGSEEALQLAAALRGMSTGRMEPLWQPLSQSAVPLLLLSGELDTKFTLLNQQLAAAAAAAADGGCNSLNGATNVQQPSRVMVGVVPLAGHALHVEAPVQVLAALQHWLQRFSS